MSDATCPERGCPGNHGWVDVDCDDRCPEHSIQSFKDLLDASSFTAAEEEYGIEIREEDKPGPGAHAMLDQFLAENRKDQPFDQWLAENGMKWD